MQRIYMHSNEHFDVFTTVLAPQGKMVAMYSYEPYWPEELRLTPGDVVLVLFKHEEGRWFGRLQDGQRGYFPASCVMELSQSKKQITSHRRTVSLRSMLDDAGVQRRHQTGHVQHALRRGNRAGGGALDWGQTDSEGPVSASHTQRSPSLLYRILSKCRRKSQCQGATNRAFEGD
ncbi:uncharacterized protein si:dkey-97a13.12 [Boleophthalmus pectinirostris]|uniref:uncharacterized protein si:dkey-97a13.12 n=1 Tax=Boleophthalmus pectinirostris TaxID=150288 RepID=UPI00242B424F|nr:uncharacterized protein si:dkey-97a13.12 [Boleophthalmus pectinirostris]